MRFTRDQVATVLAAATRPLTTVAVATACRAAAGYPTHLATSDEARHALDELAADGEAVSARYVHPYAGPGRARDAENPHAHIASSADPRSLYWATPAGARAWLAELDRRQAAVDQAQLDAAALDQVWAALGGPGGAVRARVRAGVDNAGAYATVQLDHDQLGWLVGQLGGALGDRGRAAGDVDPETARAVAWGRYGMEPPPRVRVPDDALPDADERARQRGLGPGA